MNIKIEFKKDDAPEFISLIEKIVQANIDQHHPEQVFIIYIKNWFDHKWLKFSGKGRVRLDNAEEWHPEILLTEFFRDKITFPPFTPNRILSQEAWAESKVKHSVHGEVKKHSSWNLQKRVTQFADSALFVWYSSASESNKRGSLMVYRVKESEVNTWYASFEKKSLWVIDKTKRIDKDILVKIIE